MIKQTNTHAPAIIAAINQWKIIQILNSPSIIASTNGRIESFAIVALRCFLVVLMDVPYFFASHKCSILSTTGIGSKVFSGDGESTVHSSVRPSHGSGPTFLFWRWVRNRFQNKNRILIPITNAPIVLKKFVRVSPSPALYVYTLRGIPFIRVICIGKKVK